MTSLDRAATAFLLSLLMALPGCGPGDPEPPDPGPEPAGDDPIPDWRVLDRDSLSPEEAAKLERADRARQALGGRLKKRLGAEVEAAGFASAIDVCREAAPTLAEEVGREGGLRIGRTSARLRNPASKPPVWMERLVADGDETARVFAGPDGSLGASWPIRVAGLCLNCHGTERAEGVDEALARLYPDDEATGYSAGDLRGYFWVEVP